MRYISTRGALADAPQPFSESLLTGLAPDGGLTWPVALPKLATAQLESWRDLPYADLAFEVLSLFIDDIPAPTLKDICRQTYRADVFCNVHSTETAAEIAPLTWLGEEQGTRLGLLALSNGPTLAFKDMAMQLLGRLFEHALKVSGRNITILGATSGDTGSAAEYAMRGKQGVRVFMLSPLGRMSPFQQAQMFSLMDANIFNIAMRGVFDDCQDVVKRVNADADFKAKYSIGAVNSINFGRIVAQVVYYVKGWLAATSGPGQPVSFAVPSGNFGNVLAGHIARRIGLPIHRLVVATNENKVLDEFFRTGVYRVRNSAETLETSSPSMDISKASNFERFVFDLLDNDAARTAALFAQVERAGGFDLSRDPAFGRIQDFGFVSGASSHTHRLAVIRDIAGRYGQVIDPHTADGVKVAREHLEPGVPMVILETAQPAKFGQVIEQALQRKAPRPAGFDGIEALPKRFDVLDADVEAMKRYIASRA